MFELLEDIKELFVGDKRMSALRHFARAKEFQFVRKVDPYSLPLEVQKMSFFEGNRSRSLKGLLTKNIPSKNVKARIFDYNHYHEFGNKATTVFLYECSEMMMPKFSITARNTFGRLGSIFNSTEWSSLNKEFDNEFEITSANMNWARMHFTIQFAETMLQLKGYNVECRDNYLALYRKHHQVDTIDMDNLHDDMIELISIINDDPL